MIWQNPNLLWLLLLLPLLIGGIWWFNKYKREQRNRFFSEDLFKKLRSNYWSAGNRMQSVTLYAGLFFLIIAIAGPKVGTEVREVKRQGVDLLIALDLSASMNAEDVKPSRLGKAKYEITRLIDRLRGDRIGLVIFTGDAYLQAPMTLDYSALRLFLNIADTDQMPTSSTDFSAAMETALKAFDSVEEENSSNAAKVLLIISDGENHGDSYEAALNQLTENNISIYTLGIGTQSGATIPIYDESDTLIGYKRNEQGKVVTTTLEPDVLQDIAQKGGGSYYEIQAGNDGVDSFLGRLDELQKGEFASQEYADFKNQYQWLAGVGLAFLFISLLIPNYRRKDE
ncbi:MAG: VWA domain-containing protein [Balneolaceae bacterium]|nr:VWA domain-containing protein [Balneolaceae bacterium]